MDQVTESAPSEQLVSPPGDSRELKLKNGVVLTIQKPQRMVSFTVARALGPDSTNPLMLGYYRALVWVVAVNGAPLKPLTRTEDFKKLADFLGDDGLYDLLVETQIEPEEEVTKDDLKK